MTIHLMVVGRHNERPGFNVGIEEAFVLARPAPGFEVVRCDSPRELVSTVRDVVRRTGQMIDVLDLYDHADSGVQEMGEGILFDYTGTGREIARALRPLLTRDARVRLLGCKTALGPHGQRLLTWLREELGQSIVVYGTISPVQAGNKDFEEFDDPGSRRRERTGSCSPRPRRQRTSSMVARRAMRRCKIGT